MDSQTINDPFAPGGFGCHEALHTSGILEDIVQRELCEHESIKRNPEWVALAEAGRKALSDLYFAIGKLHLKGGSCATGTDGR